MTLPTFILGGAPKAGTTSIYQHLASHPDVFMSKVKEPDFFDKKYDRGIEWYAKLFDSITHEAAIGEASVDTLASIEAERRIYKDIPSIKFIFSLRNPVDRLYSHYWFIVMRGVGPKERTFSDIIRDESSRWRNEVVRIGMYGYHVDRYVNRFGIDKLHLSLFEDLKTNRDELIASILEFVGVDPAKSPRAADRERHNVTAYPKSVGAYRAVQALWSPVRAQLGQPLLKGLYPIRSAVRGLFFTKDRTAKPAMSQEDRAYLTDLYRDSNRRLEEILDRDLSHWNEVGGR